VLEEQVLAMGDSVSMLELRGVDGVATAQVRCSAPAGNRPSSHFRAARHPTL